MNPPVGSSVRIVRGISFSEQSMLDKRPDQIYSVVRYTQPTGYAAIECASGTYLVHPEALEVVTALNRRAD